MKRNMNRCMQTQELLRRKCGRRWIKRPSLLTPKYNFLAERLDVQYEMAQRRVERLHLTGEAVQRIFVVAWWSNHQQKTIVRSNEK